MQKVASKGIMFTFDYILIFNYIRIPTIYILLYF